MHRLTRKRLLKPIVDDGLVIARGILRKERSARANLLGSDAPKSTDVGGYGNNGVQRVNVKVE